MLSLGVMLLVFWSLTVLRTLTAHLYSLLSMLCVNVATGKESITVGSINTLQM